MPALIRRLRLPGLSGRRTAGCLAATIGAWLLWTALTAGQAPALSIETHPFTFFHEFHGEQGHTNPELSLNVQDGLLNGITLWPPVEPGLSGVASQAANLMLRLPGAPGPAALSAGEIEQHRAALLGVANATPQLNLFWNLLPEWDQAGGHWVPRGRPVYNGLTRNQAYQRFSDYYETAFPGLMAHLRRPLAVGAKYRLASVTDYAPNVYRAYELGTELQLLERGIDELGDLSTGIAFLRGAARQFGRPWGIDIATWRTSTNGATKYDSGGRLIAGWSAGYLERHYYLAFAAGAEVIHNEPALYRYQDGALNPFGEANKRFADFALRRHPGLGVPSVNVAFLVDHVGGFDPKHGVNNQGNAVWYQDIPYSSGDFMTDNVLKIAYPGHWEHGLTPGAPFADSRGIPDPVRFQRFLSSGNDPRPYEPMPTTRWGDNIDVITTRAGSDVLSRYRVIFLLGDVVLDNRLRSDLTTWVAGGGILAINAAQSRAADQGLLGVVLNAGPVRTGRGSRWRANGEIQPELPYSYQTVQLNGASVLAESETGAPLITSRAMGSGEVILTTPAYLQSSARNQLLEIGVQLLDHLFRSHEAVRIEGPPVEFVIGRPQHKIVVTLANHRSGPWTGQVVFPGTGIVPRVIDYISDETMSFDTSSGEIRVPVVVPGYGVSVIALEQETANE